MATTDHPTLRWSRLPGKWIGNRGLKAFVGGPRLGTSMSALKILVAIVLRAENKALLSAGMYQGSASLSYDELSALTDVSRPMLSSAIRMLEERGLVSIKHEGVGRRNRYFLAGYGPADPWAKISNQRLYGTGSVNRVALLHQLSPRRITDMNALKLYLLLCAFRDTKTNATMIAYDKIQFYSGIPGA
jgi:DNA-binding transcriptional ArsR family regulator